MLDQKMHNKLTSHLSAFLIKLSSTRKIEEMRKKGQLGTVLLPHFLRAMSNLQYFWRGKKKFRASNGLSDKNFTKEKN